MNNKQRLIEEILTIVVDCCNIDIYGEVSITNDDVLSANRSESVCMTRCIFVTEMLFMGYSKTTIAHILHRSEKTIGNILNQAHTYRKTSYAYRIAEAESTIKLKEIMSKM